MSSTILSMSLSRLANLSNGVIAGALRQRVDAEIRQGEEKVIEG